MRFELSSESAVTLEVFDIRGARVTALVDGKVLRPGGHAVTWDGRDHAGRLAAPGVYLTRVEAGGRAWSGRIVKLDR